MKEGLGIQVEFESFPGIELAFESLARDRQGIELHNVRYDEGNERYSATVFVPDGKLGHFEKRIRDYLEEKKDSLGRPRDHQRLLDAISHIRAASLTALWTDPADAFPAANAASVWWEAWLPVRGDRQAVLSTFRKQAQIHGLEVAEGEARFPERTILLLRASPNELRESMVTLNCIAELRRPTETAEFFDSMEPKEQTEWLGELLERIEWPRDDPQTPYVCVLDTGVNRGHALIEPALNRKDLRTVEPGWGTDDGSGHGTEMAGLALFGDLTPVLAGNRRISVQHRLESVKLLPGPEGTGTDPYHHAYLTMEAVARPEVDHPSRRRVYCLAVTTREGSVQGWSSAWSATLDSLAADAGEEPPSPRLLVVASGNSSPATTADGDVGRQIVLDPAQAWNALTVGAYTNLDRITEEDGSAYTPVAPRGGLSPFSTVSVGWPKTAPLKPDVLFEGGNKAENGFGAWTIESLSLLTTHHRPPDRPFTTTWATSPATALASRFAARVLAAYPDLWPETVRALTVHSAEWTEAMRRKYLPGDGKRTKRDYLKLVRRCGFGVPDLDRAIWSASNSLSMVVQESLQPFKRETSGPPTYRELHLHDLPWPRTALQELGDTEVEMRVTLSYFIEPNPSTRDPGGKAPRSRYRYESHGLRFDIKRPTESAYEFQVRINKAKNADTEAASDPPSDPNWLVGPQSRHKGSIHSDIWRGTAADLAERYQIAVFPTTGWWRPRQALGRYDSQARYSLVVSIRAPSVDVDLYAEVAARLAAKVQTPVETGT